MNDQAALAIHINGFLEGTMNFSGLPGEWLGNFFMFDGRPDIESGLKLYLENKLDDFLLHLEKRDLGIDELERKISNELMFCRESGPLSDTRQKYIAFKIIDFLQCMEFLGENSKISSGTLEMISNSIKGNIYCFTSDAHAACLFFGKRS